MRVVSLLAALLLLAACGGAQTAAPTQSPDTTVGPTIGAVLTEEVPGATPSPAAVAGTAVPLATETAAASATPAATATLVASATPKPTDAQPTQAPSEQATSDEAVAGLTFEQVATGLDDPLFLTNAGDGSGRLFVVEKRGRIVIVRDSTMVDPAFLDITDRVGSSANEQGLLSVAFHPRFAENGLLFVDYTNKDGDTIISRFSASGDAADPASEQVLLTINQPYANHNGGLVMFGPDGYLYIGMGDGGSGGDPQGNGQDSKALLGKLLRLDVDNEQPYAIPEDNPGGELAPEVWALGLRNPWRFSFDRATGDMFIADVGQNAVEEVNFAPAGTRGGVNYGWNVLEGSTCYKGNECDPEAFTGPVTEYSHDLGQSVTGGYVYRGTAFPALQGVYVFADFSSGRVWGLRQANGAWERTELLDTNKNISSFGEDEAGELYLTSIYEGAVFRVTLSE